MGVWGILSEEERSHVARGEAGDGGRLMRGRGLRRTAANSPAGGAAVRRTPPETADGRRRLVRRRCVRRLRSISSRDPPPSHPPRLQARFKEVEREVEESRAFLDDMAAMGQVRPVRPVPRNGRPGPAARHGVPGNSLSVPPRGRGRGAARRAGHFAVRGGADCGVARRRRRVGRLLGRRG